MKALVRLLGEGTDVWRPVEVEPAPDGSEGLYRIVGQEPEHENWECKPGRRVRLAETQLSDGAALVAVPLDDCDRLPLS